MNVLEDTGRGLREKEDLTRLRKELRAYKTMVKWLLTDWDGQPCNKCPIGGENGLFESRCKAFRHAVSSDGVRSDTHAGLCTALVAEYLKRETDVDEILKIVEDWDSRGPDLSDD